MVDTGLTREQVIDALRPVQDPEIGRSLVDLGMIKDVAIEGGRVHVHVELTTPACPLRGRIETDVRQALTALPGVSEVAVQFSSRVRAAGSGMPDRQPLPGVKNTIAVASGKGGVGKSTVAVNLAIALAQDGASVGLLDADVYGPSIPIMMGVSHRPTMQDGKIVPLEAFGVKVMSVGFILDPEKALIWRGPLVSQLISQFLSDVDWGELDYLVIDLPPGTGDAQLTLVQRIPLSGAVIVTTPQDVALADAVKGLAMFREVKTTILGIIENMSYFICPKCGERSDIFGHGGAEVEAQKLGIPFLGAVPLHMEIRSRSDSGQPVVATNPDSPHAQIYRDIAAKAWTELESARGARINPPKLELAPNRDALKVTFEDGESHELTAEMLRVMSPSAEVQGHSPDQRVTVARKRHVKISDLQPVGNYAVRIVFDDGHDTGLYTWGYLRTLGREKEIRWAAYLRELEEKGLTRG